MQEKWFKHTYVCDNSNCDSLWEISTKESRPPSISWNTKCGTLKVDEPICNGILNLVSVVDVTISQGTDDQEENAMPEEVSIDNYNPHEIVTYKVVTDEGSYPEWKATSHYESAKVTELEGMLDDGLKLAKTLQDCQATNRKNRISLSDKCSSLKEHIQNRWNDADSDERDSLKCISDLFDVSLERTITFTAVIEVTGSFTADIDYSEGDSEMHLSDDLDISGVGNTEVHNWEITRVEENEDN